MNIERVAPELRDAVRKIPSPSFESALRRRIVQTALRLMPAARTAGVRIERRKGAGTDLRLYLPDERRSSAALLWIHGGGYIIGRAKQDDRLCGRTAAALGIPVISAEYRLAPDHPFPAPLDDAYAAWTWLHDNAGTLGIDSMRIAIGGESAGGGLAAALVQRVVDEEGPRPRAQWLFCPMLDDRTAARRELDAIDNFVWNNAKNRFGWRSYLGKEPGAPALPAYAAPARREDLATMPPTWIGVGDIDLFHEEDRTYADRLKAAGIDTQFVTVPGGPHGFETWAPDNPVSLEFIGQAQNWLKRALED